MDYDDAYG